MSKELTPRKGDIIFYTTPDRAVHIKGFLWGEKRCTCVKLKGGNGHRREFE
jgi:hypothetical protein